MRRRRSRNGFHAIHGTTEGAVLVEFVMVFPLLLFLLFACLQFAHIYAARQVVHYAAFCAARAALVSVQEVQEPDVDHDAYPSRLGGALDLAGLEVKFTRKESIARRLGGKARSEAEFAANRAATLVCGWLYPGSLANWPFPGEDDKIHEKVRVVLSNGDASGPRSVGGTGHTLGASPEVPAWNVAATVEHDFPLIFPLAGPVLAWGGHPYVLGPEGLRNKTDFTDDAHGDIPHLRLYETVILPQPYRHSIPMGANPNEPFGNWVQPPEL